MSTLEPDDPATQVTQVTPVPPNGDAAGAGGHGDEQGSESVVLFELGADTYALRVEQVRRVVRPAEPVRLTGAPGEVLGVMTLRGAIVAIVDPKVPLGLPATAPGRRTRVLVTDVGASLTGLLVDSVRDVIDLAPEAFAPALAGAGQTPGTAGVVTIGERTIVLLDARALMNDMTSGRPDPVSS